MNNVRYFHSKAALWVVVVSLNFLINASFTVGIAAIYMLVNNSVTFDKLGAINGIAMAMASITR